MISLAEFHKKSEFAMLNSDFFVFDRLIKGY